MTELTDKQMKEIGWEDYLLITRKWLEHYPPDIFTGVTGEPGVMFILAIREALRNFDDDEMARNDLKGIAAIQIREQKND